MPLQIDPQGSKIMLRRKPGWTTVRRQTGRNGHRRQGNGPQPKQHSSEALVGEAEPDGEKKAAAGPGPADARRLGRPRGKWQFRCARGVYVASGGTALGEADATRSAEHRAA